MDMLGQFSLKGKVALVTGASHGIGFSMAVALAGAGAEIAFNGHSPDRLKAAEAEYAARGIHARGYLCDVTDETAVQNMVARISADFGPVDILVNNAGVIQRTPLLDMSAQDFRRVVDVDLTAPFIVAKACIPGMIAK